MITNGLAEEHSHSIQAKFYAILTKNGNYTRIFVGDTFGCLKWSEAAHTKNIQSIVLVS